MLSSVLGALIRAQVAGGPTPGRLSSADRDWIEAGLAAWEAAKDKPGAAVLASQRPDLLPELERVIRVAEAIERSLETKRYAPSRTPPTISGYEAHFKLGAGGMGEVWAATDHKLNRLVAIKFMREDLREAAYVERFKKEVLLSAKLNHKHIGRIYDFGNDGGRVYYTMAFVRGLPMDEYLRESRADRHATLELMRKVCLAAEFAHLQGIVHRDLKPANILVNALGDPFILDFGLARRIPAEDGSTVSESGLSDGTIAFMSPEQARGETESLDRRSDVYTLGKILYFLLTGEHAHDITGGRFTVLQRIALAPIIPPYVRDPSMSADLQAVLMKALERDPRDRFATAAQLADEIDAFQSGRPIKTKPLGPIGAVYRWCRVSERAGQMAIAIQIVCVMMVVFELLGYLNLALQSIWPELEKFQPGIRKGEFFLNLTASTIVFACAAWVASRARRGHPWAAWTLLLFGLLLDAWFIGLMAGLWHFDFAGVWGKDTTSAVGVLIALFLVLSLFATAASAIMLISMYASRGTTRSTRPSNSQVATVAISGDERNT